jgi:hypothetical protein
MTFSVANVTLSVFFAKGLWANLDETMRRA